MSALSARREAWRASCLAYSYRLSVLTVADLLRHWGTGMENRYLLVMGRTPAGGFNDDWSAFKSFTEAITEARQALDESRAEWAHIFDTRQTKLVWEGRKFADWDPMAGATLEGDFFGPHPQLGPYEKTDNE